MRIRFFLFAVLFLFVGACAAPTTSSPRTSGVEPAKVAASPLAPALEPIRALVGTWQGADLERRSTGRMDFEPSLGGKILLRRGTNDSSEGHHEDLTIFFKAPDGLRAHYFDSEGHVIDYLVVKTGDGLELTSDKGAPGPQFRLTYRFHGDETIDVDFAIAPPGTTEFKHYTGGTVHRVR